MTTLIPKMVAKILQAKDKKEACLEVNIIMNHELEPAYANNQNDMIIKRFTDLRNAICSVLPELEQERWLPHATREMCLKRKIDEMNRVNAKIQKPITFKQNLDLNGADFVIKQCTSWLRHGLEFKMVPLIEFCMTYLVCVRPMDLNIKVRRQDGVVAGPSTHAIYNRDDCFALAVKISSKQRKHQREKPAYMTPFICKPEDYLLMQRALEFLHSDEAKALPKCYGSKKSFDKNLPCGAETSNREWSERVQSHMVKKMELEAAIETWNDNKRGFTKQLGRSFVACCLHQNIIKNSFAAERAAELALGHMLGSSADRCYLTLCVRPSQHEEVLLREVTAEAPIQVSGKNICNGLVVTRL